MKNNQRMMKGLLVGAEILVLLLILCSLPYAGAGGNTADEVERLKKVLLNDYKATEWNEDVEYSTFGGYGVIIKETFSNEELKEMFLHDLDEVTGAALERAPRFQHKLGDLCFKDYKDSRWIAGMQQGGVANKDENYHELRKEVVPIVRHLIETKKLEHFVLIMYKSGNYKIAPGVVSRKTDLNSEFLHDKFYHFGPTVLGLRESEKDNVYEV